jgi:hypothetical protein
MADYGIVIRNTSSQLQIDGTFKNLAVRERGSVVSGGAQMGTGWYYATLTTTAGSTPIVAFRSSGPCYLRRTQRSGGSVTYTFHCQGAGVTVWYWIFDDPLLSPVSGNWGLRINNASGSPVFDSRAKYMRVLDMLSSPGSLNDPIDSGIQRSYPGASPALMQGQLRCIIQNTQIGGAPPIVDYVQTMSAVAATFPGNGVSWQLQGVSVINFNRQPLPESINHWGYDYMVIDVNGM